MEGFAGAETSRVLVLVRAARTEKFALAVPAADLSRWSVRTAVELEPANAISLRNYQGA